MTTARQRRKGRSGASTGPSARAKRSQQKRLVRKPEIKGSAVIRDQWDPKLTTRQNYHKLGLVGDFSLRDSGGAAIPNAPRLGSIHEAKNAQQATVPSAGRAGMATVERDAEGNVVAIHEPGSGRADTAWGQALNSDDSDSEEQDDRGAEQSSAAAPQGKEMWTALEDAAQSAKPVERFASEGERGWLHRLVATHGTDTAAMSRDAGANVWQKTEGEIKRAIRKAGGFNALQPAA